MADNLSTVSSTASEHTKRLDEVMDAVERAAAAADKTAGAMDTMSARFAEERSQIRLTGFSATRVGEASSTSSSSTAVHSANGGEAVQTEQISEEDKPKKGGWFSR